LASDSSNLHRDHGYADLARYGDSRFLYGAGGLKDFNAMIEPLKGLGMVPMSATTTVSTYVVRFLPKLAEF
jgi:hypothetical protein